MKITRVFLIAVMFVTSSFLFSQIKEIQYDKKEIGHAGKGAGFLASLQSHSVYEDSLTVEFVTLTYRDLRYRHIMDYKSISFKDIDGTLNQFYSILKSFFSEENKENKEYKREFSLGDNTFVCTQRKEMGVRMVNVQISGGGYFYLGRKDVNSLFGKVEE